MNPADAYRCAQYSRLAYGEPEDFSRRFPEVGVRLISNDETQLYIIYGPEHNALAFRGTETNNFVDFVRNVQTFRVPWRGGKVHRGYFKAFLRVHLDMAAAVRDMDIEKPLLVTGHSLGGCLASLASITIGRKHTCITFGAPKLGDRNVAKMQEGQNRIVYKYDFAPLYPWFLWYFQGGTAWKLTEDSLEEGRHYTPVQSIEDHWIENYVRALKTVSA